MNLKEIVKTPSTKFVDVRTEQEFEMAHVKDAINIPLHTLPDNVEKIKNLDAPAIVFYCLSGNRSGQAVSFLKQSVSAINIFGQKRYAMRIWLNPDKMNAYGVAYNEVTN